MQHKTIITLFYSERKNSVVFLSFSIDGDSWPNDSAFCCPWNSTSMDLDFLEADTPEKMTSQATSPGAEISQTSMDLLDFLG